MAATLQGISVKDILFQQRNQGPGRRRTTESPRSCFGCAQKGHQVRKCPDREARKGPGLCLRYGREMH